MLIILLLNSIVLSRIVFDHFIFFWWRSHFTIICLRYFRIWRRDQKDGAIWEETTQLFVQNPLFRFLILLFGNIPDAQSHCMLYFSVEVRQIERECGDLLDPVERIIVQIKVTYRIHLNEALYAMFYSLEIGQLWSLYIIRSLIHIKTNIRIVWDLLHHQKLLGKHIQASFESILSECIAIYSVARIKWNHKTCVPQLWPFLIATYLYLTDFVL